MGFWSRLTGNLTIDDVADEVRRRLVEAGLTVERYDRGTNTFHLGSHHQVYIGNLYAEWQLRDRAAREQLLARFIRSAKLASQPIELDFETARLRLRPMVREQILLEQLRLAGPVPNADMPNTRPIGAHLVMALALDLPDSIASVNEQQLEGWKIGCDEALELAKENLREAGDGVWRQVAPGVFQAAYGDEWDASRLATPDVIRRLPLHGAPVALALQRDVLFVTGRDDDRGLVALAAAPEMVGPLSRPMSTLPVELDGDAWKPLRMPDNHPAARAFGQMTYGALSSLHAQQKELLSAWSEREGVFVSSYKAYGNDDGIFSVATCTSEITQLLPRTDRVAMVTVHDDGTSTMHGVLRWNDFAEIVGLTAPDPVRWPERYRVEVTFSATQLAEIERRKLAD